ncbi:hypothetical protein RMN57_35700 [Kitasatospora sp. CM 4170]|uniref:MoxR-vWA-beta-propeller ternary system domain-containing protein n=1 Tax=Kitasatospora aburaviensis TaxID=67265 RepID=A0ABW1EZ01_9ACTN|nr:hypothetical protein [Kitasatospora sp. CM 4170]WNM49668.1 hypothetical protein RMN57_35700 [Kitasatospora sp. CM 4170]
MTTAQPPSPADRHDPARPGSHHRAVDGPSTRPPAFPLHWERREPPLPAAAVLALGDAVPALAAAARERLRAGARLGVLLDDDPGLPAADHALLVLGAEADLPWADGARYLGRDAGLLVPTTARPGPAAALWRRALGAVEGQLCALVPGRALVADPPPPLTSPDALDAPAGPGASAADPAAADAPAAAASTAAPRSVRP